MTHLAQDVYQQYHEIWTEQFSSKEKTSFYDFRKSQLQAFLKNKFPTRENEQFKYSNLKKFVNQSFLPSPSLPKINLLEINSYLENGSYDYLVFLDGTFLSEVSSVIPEIIFSSLVATLENPPHYSESLLLNKKNENAFTQLNGAFFNGGISLTISKNFKATKPIKLLFLNSQFSDDKMLGFRNLIKVEKNASISLFEEHISLSTNTSFNNVVTHLIVEEAAEVNYCKFQNYSLMTVNYNQIEITQQKNSQVSMQNYQLGSQFSREEIHCYLNEQGATFSLQGLNLALHEQKMDLQTVINHQADHTTSEELIKCVAADQCQSIFNGKIRVEPKIKKVIANLQNKNLLLAERAEINAKPELEIYADDVKCQHGSTIGQLDKEMLFYLRSRGLSKQEAFHLLLLAFIQFDLNAHYHETIQKIITTHLVLKHEVNYV